MTSSSTGADGDRGHQGPELRPGQAVRWRTSQGETRGRIVRRLVRDGHVQGFHYRASPEDPRWLVRSDASGEEAAHRAEALEPIAPDAATD